MFDRLKKMFLAPRKKLTDATVMRLVGPNTLCYNLETNAWNTDCYNGCQISISNRDAYAKRIEKFKSEMDGMPEFAGKYKMVASVIMTIDSMSFQGGGYPVAKPKYAGTGTAVVGNIIVQDKATKEYELYCKSWIGVGVYLGTGAAVNDGAYRFALYGAGYPRFRAEMHAAHVR